MKRQRSFKMEILQIILSTVVVVITGYMMIGEQARLVQILTIIAGSLGVGIAVGVLIERRRKEKRTDITSP